MRSFDQTSAVGSSVPNGMRTAAGFCDEVRGRLVGSLTISYTNGPDTLRGVVVVDITAVTDEALTYAHRRWGDLVELHGELTPVEPAQNAGG